MDTNEHDNGSAASEDGMEGVTMPTNTPPTTPSTTTTCHVLPCNIDYQGMAPSHIYFKPALLEKGIVASTFRGRGLLAKCESLDIIENDDSNDTNTAKGAVLLEVDPQQRHLKLKAKIDQVLEWQHEHNPEVLKYDDDLSRFQMAQAWSEVVGALHDPLPLEDGQPATIQ